MNIRRATVTGASGLIGRRLVAALKRRGVEVTTVSRDPVAAADLLAGTRVVQWDALAGAAPAAALEGADAIFHLAGAPVARRWTRGAKREIRDSRTLGTANLVDGIEALAERPPVLVSASAVGYYGAHGEEPIDEDHAPGRDFLARVCVQWEQAARTAGRYGIRVITVRIGVVLDRAGGALAAMLPPFRAGLGGPVAGGRQYVPWIHAQDVVELLVAAAGDERWSGAVNATAPQPLNNRDFAHALGRVLRRPAVVPVPALALRLVYGEMAGVLTGGARVLPARALVLGHEFAYRDAEAALRDLLEA